MSILSALGLATLGQVVDVLLRHRRAIGTIVPQVVLEEQAIDDLFISSHPVERGANITDHAVKQPVQLLMRCGWSYSGTLTNITASGLAPGPREAYQALRDLQESRQPFDVVTPKRAYKNMLIKRLTQTTAVDTENALIVQVEMQEVILVDAILGPANGSIGQAQSVGPTDNTTDNGAFQAPVNLGAKQLTDVTGNLSASDNATLDGVLP
ncbi:hypothetical protein LQ772_06845 [Frateuria edaphi]|uniref:phage baseplate protein n=1 Tax=Frateuria edaphi TaxID=2898793 RepID=UPI001E5C4741|nr:hypothetical protein [Frateuria edaphi]UGB47003.1 hypothetical protein LQ772_06845 [Frateuria edaphi]